MPTPSFSISHMYTLAPTPLQAGYIRLKRDSNDSDNCGMDDSPGDGTACEGDTDPVKVCGECGILYDTSYPTGASLL